jgi:hypothetical protein
MAVITKSEMFYNDYSWTTIPGDSPRVSGPPDNTLLSRKEGYEVLYFMNQFVERQHSWKDQSPSSKKELAKKTEKMIRLVPSELRSQLNVQNWIIENWPKHPNL